MRKWLYSVWHCFLRVWLAKSWKLPTVLTWKRQKEEKKISSCDFFHKRVPISRLDLSSFEVCTVRWWHCIRNALNESNEPSESPDSHFSNAGNAKVETNHADAVLTFIAASLWLQSFSLLRMTSIETIFLQIIVIVDQRKSCLSHWS